MRILCTRFKIVALMVLGLFVVFPKLSLADSAPVATIDDFAGQLPVSGSEGSLMRLELPPSIYQHIERTDLGDIRVFDADGNLVPSEVRKPTAVVVSTDPVKVPFFPWQTDNGNNVPNRTDIQIDAAGSVIKVISQDGITATAAEPTFLLDLTSFDVSPYALRLLFDKDTPDFNSFVNLKYSNDLSNWQDFNKQTIACYGDEQKTELYEVELPDNAKYLLLTFGDSTPAVQGIEALFKDRRRTSVLRTSLFKGQKSDDGLSVTYNTDGYYPIASIDFLLPKVDSMNVELKNRLTEKAPWAYKTQGAIYRFNTESDGAEKKSKPFEISSRAPYWLIQSTDDMPFAIVPDMLIAWEPYEVVFLARGNGPWVLAYGNSNFAPVYGSALAALEDQTPLNAEIAGPEKFEPRDTSGDESNSDYQQWLLWGVLIFAVALLSLLAYYMARSMNKK